MTGALGTQWGTAPTPPPALISLPPLRALAKCPVCHGRGTMAADFYILGPKMPDGRPVTCRSCGGRGIV